MLAPPTAREQVPLRDEDLLEFFVRGERPDRSQHKIGTEQEKFGVALAGGIAPIEYQAHVLEVFEALIDRFGWQPATDRGTSGEIVALERNHQFITLEPGGQLELSGRPLTTLHETCRELDEHKRELTTVSEPLGIAWMAAGFHPFATREQVHWMPKGRYVVMRDYLPTRGTRGLDMMLRTCTVQANFDYANEKECGNRFRIALALGSIVAVMFANSPYIEGKHTGVRSARSLVWSDVDPDRCGIPAFAFASTDFSYGAYVRWALEIPMFFVKRGGIYHPHHATFREYMAHGFTDPQGRHHVATYEDWKHHLSTLFPEVRLKPYIEVRGADSVASEFVCALPALWKGILYDDDACEQAWALLDTLDYAERLALWDEARQAGFDSPRVHALCKQVLTISHRALERSNVCDSHGRNEARFLAPIMELVDAKRTPADRALARLGNAPGTDRQARQKYHEQFYFAGAR